MEKLSTKKIVGIVLAVVCIAACTLMTPPEGMSHEGLTALGILIGGVICWITNCLPMGLSCIAMLFLAYTLGVGTSSEILSGFMSTIVLFVIAMFAFAGVMTKTNLTKRIVGAIMKWAGTDSKKVIIGFFVGAFAVSAFMSAVPVCAMFGGLALSLLKNKDEIIEEYRPLGRSLMIAIPMASLLGNFVTPAGNSINLLVMGGYTQVTGHEISFAQWCMFGAPIAIVIGIIGLVMILKLFKVEDLSEESLAALKEQTASLGKLDAQEIKFLVIFGAMIVLWFASSFGLKWPGVVDTALIGLIHWGNHVHRELAFERPVSDAVHAGCAHDVPHSLHHSHLCTASRRHLRVDAHPLGNGRGCRRHQSPHPHDDGGNLVELGVHPAHRHHLHAHLRKRLLRVQGHHQDWRSPYHHHRPADPGLGSLRGGHYRLGAA